MFNNKKYNVLTCFHITGKLRLVLSTHYINITSVSRRTTASSPPWKHSLLYFNISIKMIKLRSKMKKKITHYRLSLFNTSEMLS